MHTDFEHIDSIVKRNNTFLILSHIRPDGDSLGSMLAFFHYLKKAGKSVEAFVNEDIPENFTFLPGIENIKRKKKLDKAYDITFTLDCPALDRIGIKYNRKQLGKLICIDHHFTNPGFGDFNLINEKIVSTCQIIFEYFKYINFEISEEIAWALLVGILTDSGYLQYRDVSIETFYAVTELMKKGASPSYVFDKVFRNRSIGNIRITGAALLNVKLSHDGKIAWVVISQELKRELGISNKDVHGIANKLMHIKGVVVAASFDERYNEVIIELRSEFPIEISKVARLLGGGGHKNASGCTIKGKADVVVPYVLEKLHNLVYGKENQHEDKAVISLS